MGVKSLWTLLTPVGRPVMLETVEGKIMAIDSSIWIYQFQATMRDKEGRGLVNAHVLGFLRRIAKLLFYGIRPVFVFDGGAPVLKRSTLNDRRKKKTGAAVSHVKLAEKLLAAQMRREALNHATKGKGKADIAPEDMVYLEDLEPNAPKTPPRPKPVTPSSSTKKESRFHDHDPYKLPEVDMDAVVRSKTSQSLTADPRLATEEELRSFIEDMRPEDFDVNSPEFRELPTEVQYEIIGDLRLKSRQTSFARLQKMLSVSRTPLDFSKQQIENLRKRNALTQQLLVTTDSIGSAHISIPVRIASERNKEYVLIKNDDGSGGWILGVRDPTGSRDKPIEIDQDEVKEEEEDDSDEDMEEVEVPANPTIDLDLREWQRENALGAIEKRNTDKGLAPLRTKPTIVRKRKSNPLFVDSDSDASDDDVFSRPVQREVEDDDEDLLAFAIQESYDNAKKNAQVSSEPIATSSYVTLDSYPQTPGRTTKQKELLQDDEEDMYVTPNRLETALRFARSSHTTVSPSMFGRPSLLNHKPAYVPPSAAVEIESDEDLEPVAIAPAKDSTIANVASTSTPLQALSESDEEMEVLVDEAAKPVPVQPPVSVHSSPSPIDLTSNAAFSLEPTGVLNDKGKGKGKETSLFALSQPNGLAASQPRAQTAPIIVDNSDEEMEEVPVGSSIPQAAVPSISLNLHETTEHVVPRQTATADTTIPVNDSDEEMEEVFAMGSVHEVPGASTSSNRTGPSTTLEPALQTEKSASPEPLFVPASRSPSPSNMNTPDVRHGGDESLGHQEEQERDQEQEQEFDAADLHAEEGEFVKFVSQVKGRDLNEVRKEIDEEIATLNQQRKNAMRDAEDVSQQMVNQIMAMLRLFGIPYITAPMEAEAQCAELVSLSLVDGVITDDSDVFLFGASRVFKNMFNQSKTVECFLAADLERELGLDRDTLVQLAYLLGSDYTEGLPGVGPVVAMELVREFPGKDGLWKFKEWWTKVQSGKDTEKESGTKFRRMFKKRFKDLYIADDWPNTAVRDAYYHPTVDSSDEPFKWGLPDLDGLRGFFQEELGWSQAKVDELLLPIIQKMNKRSQANALNKQGNLNDFLGVGGGSGTFAPRQRQAYASKRLQQVVSEFRKQKARNASVGAGRGKSVAVDGEGESVEGDDVDGERVGETTKKRKRPTKATTGTGKRKKQVVGSSEPAPASRGRATKGKGRGKKKVQESDSESAAPDDAFSEGGGTVNIDVPLKVELRPRPKPRPITRPRPEDEAEDPMPDQPRG